MLLNKKVMKDLVEKMKGKKLDIELVKNELKEMGFSKLPSISILNGYKEKDAKTGWVELSILNLRERITLNDEGIVL